MKHVTIDSVKYYLHKNRALTVQQRYNKIYSNASNSYLIRNRENYKLHKIKVGQLFLITNFENRKKILHMLISISKIEDNVIISRSNTYHNTMHDQIMTGSMLNLKFLNKEGIVDYDLTEHSVFQFSNCLVK